MQAWIYYNICITYRYILPSSRDSIPFDSFFKPHTQATHKKPINTLGSCPSKPHRQSTQNDNPEIIFLQLATSKVIWQDLKTTMPSSRWWCILCLRRWLALCRNQVHLTCSTIVYGQAPGWGGETTEIILRVRWKQLKILNLDVGLR